MGAGSLMFASRRLPDNLKLTAGQQTQIKSLVSAYRSAHADDLAAMRTAARQGMAARKAGVPVSVDQRRALFAQTAPVRQRLMAASTQLRSQIQQVLTSDQRAWLASHRPTRPAGMRDGHRRFAQHPST
jgi:Spy/CpxP family protein refolding chaperone